MSTTATTVADTDLPHESQRLSSEGCVTVGLDIGDSVEETRFPSAVGANVIPRTADEDLA
jgi:hypothetical protein